MGIPLLFLKYFSFFYLFLLFLSISGYAAYSLIPFSKNNTTKSPESFKALIYSLLLGSVFYVVLFSIITTGFRTINLLFFILGLVFIIKNKQNFEFHLTHYLNNLKLFIRKHFLNILIMSFPFYMYEAIWFLKSGSFNYTLPFVDYLDMYNISQVITLTGQENNKYLLSNIYFPEFHGMSPYHFFELWFNGMLSKLLPFPGTLTLMLFVYPFFYFTSYIGILAVWEHFGRLNIYKILISFLLLFIGGMYFDFYLKYELLMWYGGAVGNIAHIWGKKMAILFPFVVITFLNFLQQKYFSSILLFLSLGIIAIGVMPGIVCGVLFFLVTNFSHKTLSKEDLKWAFVVFTIYVLLFPIAYFVFGSKNEESLGFTSILNDFLSAINSNYFKKLFFSILFPILRILIILSPFLIFVIFALTKASNVKKDFNKLLLLLLFILFSGAVIGALASINIFSGGQFFSYLFILIHIFIICTFVYYFSHFSINSLKSRTVLDLFFIIIFTLACSYNIYNNIKLEKHYKSITDKLYSYSYLENVTTYLNTHKLNPYGVCFMGTEDKVKYPLNAYGITGITFSGLSVKLTNEFHAVSNLNIFELPLDTSDNFSSQLFKSFEFYNFVKFQQKHNTFKDYESSKLDFINQFAIDYALIYKGGKLPAALSDKIAYELTDSYSGQRFVVFK